MLAYSTSALCFFVRLLCIVEASHGKRGVWIDESGKRRDW